MKKIAFGFLLFIFALGVAQPVSAHGGQPRLEINVDHINPGAVVDVRGVEFGYDDLVVLALIGSEAEIALGEMQIRKASSNKLWCCLLISRKGLIISVPQQFIIG